MIALMRYVCYTAYNTKERIDNIENHLKQILPDLIVLKSEGEVNIQNACNNCAKALELIAPTGGMLLEDDIRLPDNFVEVSNRIIEEHKNEIVSFYRYKCMKMAQSGYARFAGNQCVYFPQDICKDLADMVRNFTYFKQYNEAFIHYLRLHPRRVWFVQPNIIEHLDFTSTIGNPYQMTH